jgi:hypothetical protein
MYDSQPCLPGMASIIAVTESKNKNLVVVISPDNHE